jgi:branched-subunit amino acid transport protein
MTEFATLIAAGVITWALRASFISVGPGWQFPPLVEELLNNGRFAIIAALATSAIVASGDGSLLDIPAAWLIGGAVATAAALSFRNIAWPMVAGIGAVWVLSFAGL